MYTPAATTKRRLFVNLHIDSLFVWIETFERKIFFLRHCELHVIIFLTSRFIKNLVNEQNIILVLFLIKGFRVSFIDY